jgi:hypothetical protein
MLGISRLPGPMDELPRRLVSELMPGLVLLVGEEASPDSGTGDMIIGHVCALPSFMAGVSEPLVISACVCLARTP